MIARPLAPVILGLLTLDAFITLVLEVLFLPSYLGAVPFPITALVAGVANVLIVLGVRTVTARLSVAFLPLGAWMLGFLVCASSGPGGSVLLLSDWRTLALVLLGLIPPLALLYFRVNARAGASAKSSTA
ncbi:hypothetical protein D5S18_13400 [Nocardia panacis]|uniref:Facilitated glucose transporter n=1 Tax=Nocardia panacis TaxID=2340916 RepID=A0A3A4JY19_9NOCA|nr:hypothetical protein [Nocardia panacis]RJO75777.1 hypothetical protein D5S18_13400 [Nocardia panacis]